jgi:hypothetical protein
MDVKNILALVVALLIGFTLGQYLVGDNQSGPSVGSGTRFPSGLSADGTSPSTGEVRGTTLTTTGAATVGGTLAVTGELTGLVGAETVSADDTITTAQCGSTFFLSTTGSTSTLPAATEGCEIKFIVGAAFATNDYRIDSAEGDNISGTLSVNNADVACSAEDQINFIADGETVGDYVSLVSDGTNWLIAGSDAETAAKITCTDPS